MVGQPAGRRGSRRGRAGGASSPARRASPGCPSRRPRSVTGEPPSRSARGGAAGRHELEARPTRPDAKATSPLVGDRQEGPPRGDREPRRRAEGRSSPAGRRARRTRPRRAGAPLSWAGAGARPPGSAPEASPLVSAGEDRHGLLERRSAPPSRVAVDEMNRYPRSPRPRKARGVPHGRDARERR